ncbi:TetR/AcrR family transcriptional regulator [Irregularibacter muris]|uniref:TetR/AcrR family transcriptional regulator n=1 Tax=Irregularibacter muris TaxID=1796619 RepID=A0AAE3HDR4_9FIRM|nr:TetR/AcrR family transcriptional regulator [Irregularibacter muris]MCR1897474.1 TetR/AcrR family transcriptional regulator [Irregularibacter muris]
MGRENKKEVVAALHREQIMISAERLFLEKGFVQTTIDDISKASEYSRRTIYSYYENKDDILYHIIEKGLLSLKANINAALSKSKDFFRRYHMICTAFKSYQYDSPSSMDSVIKAKPTGFGDKDVPEVIARIFSLGDEINQVLASFIEDGIKQKVVREDINPMATVYIMWSNISSLLSLAQTKEVVIKKQLGMTENEFLDYGFTQIINSLLKEHL